jgi:hypothetical protein
MKMQVSSLSHLALGEIWFGLSPPLLLSPIRLEGYSCFRTTSPKPKEHKDEESKPICPIDVMAVSKEAEASSPIATSPLVAR